MKINIPTNHNHITLIFTNNIGDEKIPMTPWIVAHRFGHAISMVKEYQSFRIQVVSIFQELLKSIFDVEKSPLPRDRDYERLVLQLMSTFGTMKSAKSNNIRNIFEFPHELLAQYIINGQIKFDNSIPRTLVRYYVYGHPVNIYSKIHKDIPMVDYIKDKLEYYTELLNESCALILNSCIGRIFVI